MTPTGKKKKKREKEKSSQVRNFAWLQDERKTEVRKNQMKQE